MDSGKVRCSRLFPPSPVSGCPRLDDGASASGGFSLDLAARSLSSPSLAIVDSVIVDSSLVSAAAVSSTVPAYVDSVSDSVSPSDPCAVVSAPCNTPPASVLEGVVLDESSSAVSREVSVPAAGVEGPASCSARSGDGSTLHLVSSVLQPPSATFKPMPGILPTPRSPRSLFLPTSTVYPVSSLPLGQSVGSSSASYVSIGDPVGPESARQRPSSNFELSDKNFPPLLSHSVDSAGPPRSSCPTSPSAVPSGTAAPSSSGTVAPASWASLVKDPSSFLPLKFINPAPVSVDGKLKIKLPPAIADKGASVWKDTLVGFFLDKLPISLVQATASRIWGKMGLTDVLCNGNGFFFFKFSDSASLNLVLNGGPWYFGGRPIFLKLWIPGMNLSKDGCKRVPIWAHFYNVPLELWTDEGLSFIASTVGKPLHADASTSSFKRLHYARLCIEINIDDSLPNSFDVELEDGSCLEINIVYSWVPKKCSVCKEFGHLSKNCKKASHLVWKPKSAQHPAPSTGDWQTVNNFSKDGLDKHSPSALLPHPVPAPSLPTIHSGGLCSSSNTFAALASEDAPPSSVTVDKDSLADQFSEVDGFSSKASALPGASELPVGPLLCSPARLDRDPLLLSGLSSPPSGSLISSPSSPSSSPSASSLLANKLIMVDEVERILGRKTKDKKKCRSSGNSRGKTSKSSK